MFDFDDCSMVHNYHTASAFDHNKRMAVGKKAGIPVVACSCQIINMKQDINVNPQNGLLPQII